MVTREAHILKLVVRFNYPLQLRCEVKKSFTTHVDWKEKVYIESEPDVIKTVSGFLVRPGAITIGLTKGENESWHQPWEVIPYKSKIFTIKGFKK